MDPRWKHPFSVIVGGPIESIPSGINIPVSFKEGLPDFEESTEPRLLVIDDMMLCKDDGQIVDLFTRVCFRNPRDKAQIRHLPLQICPQKPLFIQEAYMDATSEPHGYLVLDLKQDTPDDYCFRANIFPSNPVQYVKLDHLEELINEAQQKKSKAHIVQHYWLVDCIKLKNRSCEENYCLYQLSQ